VFIFYFFFFLRVLSYFFGYQPWDFPYGNFGYFNNFLTVAVLFANVKFLLFNPIRQDVYYLKSN